MNSDDCSRTPPPPISPRLLRVARMRDPATLANHPSEGRFKIPPHVALMSKKIAAPARKGGRLLIQTPRRHGKSELVSVWTPIWLLNAFPKKRVILASYEADFAASGGRRARSHIEEYQDQ